jgi:hypothetical protein
MYHIHSFIHRKFRCRLALILGNGFIGTGLFLHQSIVAVGSSAIVAKRSVHRFLCVDRMHRVTAARRLKAEDDDFGGWPPGGKDEHGKVRLECLVLF